MTERKMSYAEQLKHPKWQERRLRMLDAAGFRCSSCDANESTLHVHHKRYIKGRSAWDYADDELAVLCENCHQEEHDIDDVLARLLAASSCGTKLSLASLIAGYLVSTGGDATPSLTDLLMQLARDDVCAFDSGAIAGEANFWHWDQWLVIFDAACKGTSHESPRYKYFQLRKQKLSQEKAKFAAEWLQHQEVVEPA